MSKKLLEPTKEFYVRIGEGMKACLDRQKELIEKSSYGVLKNESYFNAGEILAKKIMDSTMLD